MWGLQFLKVTARGLGPNHANLCRLLNYMDFPTKSGNFLHKYLFLCMIFLILMLTASMIYIM